LRVRVVSFLDQSIAKIQNDASRVTAEASRARLPRRFLPRFQPALPPSIGFLTAYGVAPDNLMQALLQAGQSGVRPEVALMASGLVTEEDYYRALARHLGLAFIDDHVDLGPGAHFPNSVMSGVAPLPQRDHEAAWLFAPQGRLLDDLLALHRRRAIPRHRFQITSPRHLRDLIFAQRGETIAHAASHELQEKFGRNLSAASAGGWNAFAVLAAIAAVFMGTWLVGGIAWMTLSLIFSLFMAGGIIVRLFATAASCETRPDADVPMLRDDELPVYSVVVALYREANVAPALVAALDNLDYPPGKLDIQLVVEAEDLDTFNALDALDLPSRYRITVAPDGQPRTKPRALNVALAGARGSLICVFDAEDIPQASQLREAASRFAAAPHRVACLQGRLAIDNFEDGWLVRCFAIEYAALFDVINPGLSALRLPIPLGGTSNHFRTQVLREIGGWDAWNVTEDIDLGLRLARMGYDTDTISASTSEEAPAVLKAWVRQRRRWFKGWIQTLLVHFANPRAAVEGMGPMRACAAGLYVGGTLAGAMLGPLFALLVFHDAVYGRLLHPETLFEWFASTCWCFVAITGFFAAFWPPVLGVRRRALLQIATSLPLMIPYWVLSTVAAWWALVDFIRNPFHWLKTEHGVARRRAQRPVA
jgi:cellulose synthase/poly-beta-1,6-N-acetylglucosamine synthase-like glycosyltransferase